MYSCNLCHSFYVWLYNLQTHKNLHHQEFLTIPSINKRDVRRCIMTIITHMEVYQDLPRGVLFIDFYKCLRFRMTRAFGSSMSTMPLQYIYEHLYHFDSFTATTMTLLTVTEYMFNKCPGKCSVCPNHNPVLSSFMTYHMVCNKSNTTGVKYVAGIPYNPSVFSGIHVVH
jgi:hypothetical protein